jgi:hypothetical protein
LRFKRLRIIKINICILVWEEKDDGVEWKRSGECENLLLPRHLTITFLQNQDTCLEGMFECFQRHSKVSGGWGSISITLRSAESSKHSHIHVTFMLQLEVRSSGKLRLQCCRVFMPLKRCRAPNPCLPYSYDAIPSYTRASMQIHLDVTI